ncbi:MAG TPA: hypothetical protein VGV91_15565 [Rubrobacter sp.]|nr:hypothetical protein [Rubrobacter sp.]
MFWTVTCGRTASETASETAQGTEGADPGEKAGEEAAYVHTATDANSRGDYTYLDHPRIDGDPGAVVLVQPSPGRGGQAGAAYGHNIGVWYEPEKKKWAIFNQDLAVVPAGAAFEVVVPPADRGFVHRAALQNTVGNATYWGRAYEVSARGATLRMGFVEPHRREVRVTTVVGTQPKGTVWGPCRRAPKG